MNYAFVVDRETCFAHWAQCLVRWSWFFEQYQYAHYRALAEPWSAEEDAALDRLKELLERESYGYLWLWSRYTNRSIDSKEEEIVWKEIQDALADKFNAAWSLEEPLLRTWKNVLESHDDAMLGEVRNTIARFLHAGDLMDTQSIESRLVFRHHTRLPAGHAQERFPNTVILGVSRVKTTDEGVERVLNVHTHELTHLMFHRTQTPKELVGVAYREVIEPKNFSIPPDTKWKYLLAESLLRSISSHRLDTYAGRVGARGREGASASDAKETPELAVSEIRGNREALIGKVAARAQPIVGEYLDAGTPMDGDLCRRIALYWVDLLEEIENLPPAPGE